MTPGYPRSFGYDVVDCLELDLALAPPFGYDTVDWIEDLAHALPTRCLQCHTEWLTGPEALAAGRCWRCRTNGGPHE